jgi:hypothetical protein
MLIARTGRFLTFSAGAATIGARMREDPRDRTALRLVSTGDGGVIVNGKVGMHTSPAYAEDVYIGSHSGIDIDGHRATVSRTRRLLALLASALLLAREGGRRSAAVARAAPDLARLHQLQPRVVRSLQERDAGPVGELRRSLE